MDQPDSVQINKKQKNINVTIFQITQTFSRFFIVETTMVEIQYQ